MSLYLEKINNGNYDFFTNCLIEFNTKIQIDLSNKVETLDRINRLIFSNIDYLSSGVSDISISELSSKYVLPMPITIFWFLKNNSFTDINNYYNDVYLYEAFSINSFSGESQVSNTPPVQTFFKRLINICKNNNINDFESNWVLNLDLNKLCAYIAIHQNTWLYSDTSMYAESIGLLNFCGIAKLNPVYTVYIHEIMVCSLVDSKIDSHISELEAKYVFENLNKNDLDINIFLNQTVPETNHRNDDTIYQFSSMVAFIGYSELYNIISSK